MRISKYGVELTTLIPEDLELVRTWRNQSDVAEHMFFQEEITPEMHQSWFSSLDISDVYWMISHDAVRIGVINVKQINWLARSGEAGIFIGDSRYRNSPLCMMAVAAMMDVFFGYFDFSELRATIKKGNENAIDFNLKLGYRIVSEDHNAYYLTTNSEHYGMAISRFTSIFHKLGSDEMTLELNDEERRRFLSNESV